MQKKFFLITWFFPREPLEGTVNKGNRRCGFRKPTEVPQETLGGFLCSSPYFYSWESYFPAWKSHHKDTESVSDGSQT